MTIYFVSGTKIILCHFLCWFNLLHLLSCSPNEVRLINDLLSKYNPYERPALEDKQPLVVEFLITLQQIIDVDEKNQMINTNIWLTMQWTDYKLAWDPLLYGNITEIRLPARLLWKPDILMYNSADSAFDGTWPVNMVVTYTGGVLQLPPGIFTSSCPINIRWFPFDEQTCDLKFGSWTYDGTKIDLRVLGNASSGSLDGYRRSGEWDLIKMGLPAKRNIVLYDCCPDNPYIDLTFSINIKRRKLFYLVNIVLPCVMLSGLTLLTFLLPCEAGEKISFGVTILLSLTVFLLLVAEALPATSDAVPLIAIYFSAVMLMNAASVVFTVLVLCYHHRTAATHTMPNWVRKGVCIWLAWVMRMKRPGKDDEVDHKRLAKKVSIELGDKNGHTNTCLITSSREGSTTPSSMNTPLLSGSDFRQYRTPTNCGEPLYVSNEFTSARLELRHILKELQYLTNRKRVAEEDEKTTADWKFAASVIDRLLLWIFLFFGILCSCCILLSVPGMFRPEGDYH